MTVVVAVVVAVVVTVVVAVVVVVVVAVDVTVVVAVVVTVVVIDVVPVISTFSVNFHIFFYFHQFFDTCLFRNITFLSSLFQQFLQIFQNLCFFG